MQDCFAAELRYMNTTTARRRDVYKRYHNKFDNCVVDVSVLIDRQDNGNVVPRFASDISSHQLRPRATLRIKKKLKKK